MRYSDWLEEHVDALYDDYMNGTYADTFTSFTNEQFNAYKNSEEF